MEQLWKRITMKNVAVAEQIRDWERHLNNFYILTNCFELKRYSHRRVSRSANMAWIDSSFCDACSYFSQCFAGKCGNIRRVRTKSYCVKEKTFTIILNFYQAIILTSKVIFCLIVLSCTSRIQAHTHSTQYTNSSFEWRQHDRKRNKKAWTWHKCTHIRFHL